jgi:hypothetical protein
MTLSTVFYENRFNEENLTRYSDGFLRGLAQTGGIIFASVNGNGAPDRRLVLGWRCGNTPHLQQCRDRMGASAAAR